jgi:ribA/ribD-fused uncharacterized protein
MDAEQEKPLIMHFNGLPMVLFYGHSEGKVGRYLSNFYPTKFTADIGRWSKELMYAGAVVGDNYEFSSSEQYLMFRKAMLFNDVHTAMKILQTESPASAKALGRKVADFNEEKWAEHRLDIMVDGLTAKFRNEPLRTYLLETGNATIVECAPNDPVWGIGLKVGDLDAFQRERWKGLNLLGEALERAREILRGEV